MSSHTRDPVCVPFSCSNVCPFESLYPWHPKSYHVNLWRRKPGCFTQSLSSFQLVPKWSTELQHHITGGCHKGNSQTVVMYSRGHLEGTTLPKRCGITRQKIECIVKSVSFDREFYSGEISIEYILDSKVISHSTLQDRPTHTTFSIVFPVKGFHHKIPDALWPEGWMAAVTLCPYWLSTKLFIHVHVYAGCPCGSESIRSGEIGSPTTLLSRKYSLYWKGRETFMCSSET